jgi:transposase
MDRVWAGMDAGKTEHHCQVIDADGRRLLSRRVANDEAPLRGLLDDVTALGDEVTWAIDIPDGGAALLIGLLLDLGQQVLYIPGQTVHRAAGGYRGQGKTDARDAAVIADQARIRRDLHPLRAGDEVVAELKILTARRTDLVADRTRIVNRLRSYLLGVFRALERTVDPTNRGPLVLLTGFQTPQSLRTIGADGLTAWLRERHVRGAAAIARAAIEAAQAQTVTLPGQRLTAQLVARLAGELLALGEDVHHVELQIEATFHRHRHAAVIQSPPGIGVILGAEFLAGTGGDMAAFASADHLAGFAGLAPVPNGSGRVSGNLHRPRRYHRGLQRVFYTSALISIRCNPDSRIFYDRKRAEGKRHTQTVLALARRRVNVLWVLLRDERCYTPARPTIRAA